MPTHRTAIFRLHHPTRRVRSALDAAFGAYERAFTVAMDAFAELSTTECLALATYGCDPQGQPRRSIRRLEQMLFRREQRRPQLTAALAPLEYGLREGLCREVARTLLSRAAQATQREPSCKPTLDAATPREETRALGGDLMAGGTEGIGAHAGIGGLPNRQPPALIERERRAALAELATLADDVAAEAACVAGLQRTAVAGPLPLPFVRVEAERGCGLFYNPGTRRFYARLYVISRQARAARRLTHSGQYIDLRTGQVYLRAEDACPWHGVRSFGKCTSAILVPLELGRWHETALRFTETAFLPQRGHPFALAPGHTWMGDGRPPSAAVPVTAWLVKRQADYYLHVVFRFPTPPRVEPRALLGLDRGLTCLAAGAVVSLDTRQVLETVRLDGSALAQRQRAQEVAVRTGQQRGHVVRSHLRTTQARAEIHRAANEIVELAQRFAAQVVMEDLRTFAAPRPAGGDGGAAAPRSRLRCGYRALRSRRQYQRLLHTINAKLALVGLPPVRLVSPAYTSITCAACGVVDRASRCADDRTQFRCVACGHEAHADLQAGITIARKTLWLAQRQREHQQGIPPSQRTSWRVFLHEWHAAGQPLDVHHAANRDIAGTVESLQEGGRHGG